MNKFACLPLWLLISSLQGCLAVADVPTPNPVPVPGQNLQSLAELVEQPPAARALKIHGWKSPAGGKVLFIRTTELPMFDLHVSFPAGSTRDGAHPGLAAATFSLLNEGVPGKDLAAIIETFDGLGAKFTMDIDQDRASLSLRSLTAIDKRDPALQMFSQILGQPLLSEDALTRVKSELLEILKTQQQDLGSQTAQAMNTLLLADHPYAQPVFGTEKGVKALTRQQVQAFHQQAYSAANVQISLVGDLTLEQAQAISVKVFEALPAGAVIAPVTPIPPRMGDATSRHIERALSQTQIMLGQRSIPPRHADFLALRVAHMIFGGQKTTSRLMTELREKRGLTYGVQLKTLPWQGGGPAVISLNTSPPFSQGAVTLVQSLYREYLRTGPTPQELAEALQQLRSSAALSRASNAQILARLVDVNQYDLPLDLDFAVERAQGLTVEELKAAMNRHFDPGQWSVVTVGPSVEQQPLPLPTSEAPQSMCRAEPGFVAS